MGLSGETAFAPVAVCIRHKVDAGDSRFDSCLCPFVRLLYAFCPIKSLAMNGKYKSSSPLKACTRYTRQGLSGEMVIASAQAFKPDRSLEYAGSTPASVYARGKRLICLFSCHSVTAYIRACDISLSVIKLAKRYSTLGESQLSILICLFEYRQGPNRGRLVH
jgi:hypothetical protein